MGTMGRSSAVRSAAFGNESADAIKQKRVRVFQRQRKYRLVCAIVGMLASAVAGVCQYQSVCHMTSARGAPSSRSLAELLGVLHDTFNVSPEDLASADETTWCPAAATGHNLALAAKFLNGIALATTVAVVYYVYKQYRFEVVQHDGMFRPGEKFVSKLLATELFGAFVLEMLLCAVCPFPWGETLVVHVRDFGRVGYPDHVAYSWNEIGSIIINVRFYLMFRLTGLVFYEKDHKNTETKGGDAIRRLAKVPRRDTERSLMFALRCFFHTRPLTFVTTLMVVCIWCHSWAVWVIERGCNVTFAGGIGFAEAVYGVIVTSTTVGYGDTTPISSMGRWVFMSAAVCGTGIIALLVAAVTEELELDLAQQRLIRTNQEALALYAMRDKGARCIQAMYRSYIDQVHATTRTPPPRRKRRRGLSFTTAARTLLCRGSPLAAREPLLAHSPPEEWSTRGGNWSAGDPGSSEPEQASGGSVGRAPRGSAAIPLGLDGASPGREGGHGASSAREGEAPSPWRADGEGGRTVTWAIAPAEGEDEDERGRRDAEEEGPQRGAEPAAAASACIENVLVARAVRAFKDARHAYQDQLLQRYRDGALMAQEQLAEFKYIARELRCLKERTDTVDEARQREMQRMQQEVARAYEGMAGMQQEMRELRTMVKEIYQRTETSAPSPGFSRAY